MPPGASRHQPTGLSHCRRSSNCSQWPGHRHTRRLVGTAITGGCVRPPASSRRERGRAGGVPRLACYHPQRENSFTASRNSGRNHFLREKSELSSGNLPSLYVGRPRGKRFLIQIISNLCELILNNVRHLRSVSQAFSPGGFRNSPNFLPLPQRVTFGAHPNQSEADEPYVEGG